MKKDSLSQQTINKLDLKAKNKFFQVNKAFDKSVSNICPKAQCAGGVCLSTWKPYRRPAA